MQCWFWRVASSTIIGADDQEASFVERVTADLAEVVEEGDAGPVGVEGAECRVAAVDEGYVRYDQSAREGLVRI